MSDKQNTYCELSDEEIKLVILELTARDRCLTEISYDEINRLKEIFQWVKGA